MAKNNTEMTCFDDFENVSMGYSSFVSNDRNAKVLLYNAVNSPDYQVSDFVGKEIAIRDIVIEKVNLTDRKTGEQKPSPRCVLIDNDGKSYSCVSFGMFHALQKLSAVFGMPSWEDPILVEVQNITTNGGNKTLTLKAL